MISFMKKYNPVVVTAAVLLLVGCGGSNTTQQQLAEWSVKIVAEDTKNGLQFDNDRLGQVKVATNDVDSYDLKSMPRPFPTNNEGELNPFLSVNFPQSGKDYVTNFHSTEMNDADEWVWQYADSKEQALAQHEDKHDAWCEDQSNDRDIKRTY